VPFTHIDATFYPQTHLALRKRNKPLRTLIKFIKETTKVLYIA